MAHLQHNFIYTFMLIYMYIYMYVSGLFLVNFKLSRKERDSNRRKKFRFVRSDSIRRLYFSLSLSSCLLIRPGRPVYSPPVSPSVGYVIVFQSQNKEHSSPDPTPVVSRPPAESSGKKSGETFVGRVFQHFSKRRGLR